MSKGEEGTATQLSASSTTGNMDFVSMFQPTILTGGIKLAHGNFAAWENRFKCQHGIYNTEHVDVYVLFGL